MSTYDEIAERYIATWNEPDPERRRVLVGELYGPDARYSDPMVVADGRDEIAATIGAVRAQFPGMAFRLAGPVDGHHAQARFGWELAPEGGAGEAVVAGFDVAVLGDDGSVATVLGFLDKVPETV